MTKMKSLCFLGFPDHFVCKNGFVYTRKIRGSTRLLEKPRQMKLGLCRDYKICTLRHDGKVKTFRVNRLVALAFLENIQNKEHVNHIDGNKKNNTIENLEWVTLKENIDHAFKNKLISRKGSKNSQSKLSESDVKKLKLLYKLGHKQKELSYLFNLKQNTISQIVNNKLWKHVNCGDL